MSEDEEAALAAKLDTELREEFGSHLLNLHDITKALNYNSVNAVRQAVSRNTIPIPLFNLPNRHGKFALTLEVAKFLARQASMKETTENRK